MIPHWNIQAVIPPVRPGAAGRDPDRSPYLATMLEVVDRFATSAARIAILRGLLAYRAEIAKCGMSQGFQWLDGSFMENKELLQNAAPNDVDVVTFHHLPAGVDEATFLNNHPALFDHPAVRARYRVDSYAMVLGNELTGPDVRQISYWIACGRTAEPGSGKDLSKCRSRVPTMRWPSRSRTRSSREASTHDSRRIHFRAFVIRQLQSLLAEIPVERAISRRGLEQRLAAASEAIANIVPGVLAKKARLTFRGRPVFGSHGVSAEFGSKAARFFIRPLS